MKCPKMFGDFFVLHFKYMNLFSELDLFMFPRCDNNNKRPGPLEAEVIPVLHSVAEANASDESDGLP
jgi:hypothetical protein